MLIIRIEQIKQYSLLNNRDWQLLVEAVSRSHTLTEVVEWNIRTSLESIEWN